MTDLDTAPDPEEVYDLSGQFARAIAELTASHDSATIVHALLDLAVNAGIIDGQSEVESLENIRDIIAATLAAAKGE